jgi:DNA-binding beta-propeller fold protein YncE
MADQLSPRLPPEILSYYGEGGAELRLLAGTSRFALRFGTGTVSGDGFLSILDVRSERVLRTVDVPDPWGMAVDRRIGVAYISDEDNAVSVLDLHSGTVVRTLPGP